MNPQFPLSTPLLMLGSAPLTLRLATAHLLCVGNSGSGKTSAVLRTVAQSLLRKGLGFFVLCSKSDDRQMWVDWASQTGRSVKVWSPGQSRFDLLGYLLNHPDPAVSDLGHVIDVILEMVESSNGTRQEDTGGNARFFRDQKLRTLTHLLTLAKFSGKKASFQLLVDILAGAPTDPDAKDRGDWKRTALGEFLTQAAKKTEGSDARLVEKARDFFLKEYPTQPRDTRGGATMDVLGVLEQLTDPSTERLMAGNDFRPEDVLSGGILIVDLPETPAGRMLSLGLKRLVQEAALRRSVGPDDAETIPLVFCTDEFHNWITRRDPSFMARARSSRVICFSLTQSVSGMVEAIGGQSPQQAVDALCACFATRIFLASDAITAEWASKSIGKSPRFKLSSQDQHDPFTRPGMGVGMDLDYDVHPHELMALRTGGPENDYEVDGIVVMGEPLIRATGKPWEKVVFLQRDGDRASGPSDSDHESFPQAARRVLAELWDNHWAVRLVRASRGLLRSLGRGLRKGHF